MYSLKITRLKSGTKHTSLNRLVISHVLKSVEQFKLVDVAKDLG